MHIGARAGAIWTPVGTNLKMICCCEHTTGSGNSLKRIRCKHLLEQVVVSGRGLLRPTYGDTLLDETDSEAGDGLIFVIPVERMDTVVAIFEIGQEPVATVERRHEQLQFLEDMCVLSSNLIGKLMDAERLVERRPVFAVSRSLQTQSTVVSCELLGETGAECVLDTAPARDAVPVATIGKKRWWQVWKN